MAEHSAIEWTDSTFNPWWGCAKVSPACDHCYAERDAHRFAPGRVLWGVGAERRTFGEKHWNEPLKWAQRGFAACSRCGWRGEQRAAIFRDAPGETMPFCPQCDGPVEKARRRVFCASMADWLDLDAPIGEFVRLLDTIRCTPELDWLLLSKRIGNWRKRVAEAHSWCASADDAAAFYAWTEAWLRGTAPDNVWLGSTVIDQAEADRDLPKLLAVPARVRFLSIEPMLGPISFEGMFANPARANDGTNALEALSWIICGGESGPQARPMHPDWARSLRDQCAAAGVPFLFKQWGEWGPDWEGAETCSACGRTKFDAINSHGECGHCGIDGWMSAEKPLDKPRRVGKKAAGRLLDGRTHDDFPLTKLAAENERREPSLFPPT